MKYCKYCGKQLEGFQPCSCAEAQVSSAKISKIVIAAVSIVAVVTVLTLVIVAIANTNKVNPFDYVSVSFEGYNGGGKAVVSVNTSSILEEIMGTEPTESLEKTLEWAAQYEQHRENIQWTCSQEEGLSNGDTVVITFTVTDETAKKVQSGSASYSVNGLPDIETVDIFSEYYMTFSGVNGAGKLDYSTDSSDSCVGACLFSFEPTSNYSNGDTVTVTITNEDYLINTFGKRPQELTKTFTASGLSTYITQSDQIPKDELIKLASDFLEIKREALTDTSMFQYKDITIEGCYLVKYISGWTDSVELWIVVSCKKYTYEEYDKILYFPLKFDKPVLQYDGILGYKVEDGNYATFHSGTSFPTENMLAKYVMTEIELPESNFPLYNPSSTNSDTAANGSSGGSTASPSGNSSSSGGSAAASADGQVADPSTGISWDGVSPIIYTYADGTTGTTPVEGATYEVVPGVTMTYVIWRDGAGRADGSICDTCGREVAHSLSRGIYCVQHNCAGMCTECGDLFEAFVCHTCKNYVEGVFYCEYCGKVSGDGSNGTCIRWSFVGGDHTCPCCGAVVPEHTCHTCDED